MDDALSAEAELRRLLGIMAALRDPATGCPWDKEQTFDSIAPYTIEEAYEVADSIARRDFASLPEVVGRSAVPGHLSRPHGQESGLFAFTADVDVPSPTPGMVSAIRMSTRQPAAVDAPTTRPQPGRHRRRLNGPPGRKPAPWLACHWASPP